MMRKIALRGLAGRKRDTALLWSVVALAFLFLVLSTTLITSLEKTDARQRIDTYGSWQVMAGFVTEEGGRALAAGAETAALTPMLPVVGDQYFSADNDYYLGVYTPEFARLGNLTLREGRWPEKRNEVVLEYAKLAALGLEVGDSFHVFCDRKLPMTPETAAARQAAFEADTEANVDRARQASLELFRSGDWEAGKNGLWLRGEMVIASIASGGSWGGNGPDDLQVFAWWWHKAYKYSQELFGQEKVPLWELTEEQFSVVLEEYLRQNREFFYPVRKSVADLLGHQEMSIRVSYMSNSQGELTLQNLYSYTIVGVVETYSDRWDSGRTPLPAGFVTEESYQLYLEAQQVALEKYPGYAPQGYRHFALLKSDGAARDLWRAGLPTYNDAMAAAGREDWSPVEPEHMEEPPEFSAYRLNRFAYPASAEGGLDLLMLVMGILFVTTVCAVFQIFFTQVRRRLRRIVLMKSVGAETGQIAKMLGWEFLFFWGTALPAGTVLGLGSAWAAAKILSNIQDRTVLLDVRPAVLLAALLVGTFALLIGMAVPMVMAVGVPLTGRTARKKPLPPPKRETRQDFLHVTIRGLRANLVRTAGSFALCAFMVTIAVLCLFLGFRFLGEYRDTVQRNGQPDYRLHCPYAMSDRQTEEFLAELRALGVAEDIQTYRTGAEIHVDVENWEASPILAAAGTEGSYSGNLYCVSSADELFAAYNAAATVGRLDPAAFDAGEQVLLMVPLYRDGGKADSAALEEARGWDRLAPAGIDTSYYAEYDGVYRRDDALRVGDEVRLWTENRIISESGSYMAVKEKPVTVGAILYYFPEEGIWPVSGSGEGYQLLGSSKLLARLRPSAVRTRGEREVMAIFNVVGTLYTNEYGKTDFYLTAPEGADLEAADTALLVYARAKMMEIEVYHESSQKLLRDAVNNILLCCLLGLTAVLLALVIFANTVVSDVEQERGRIGILQSLGVSNRQLILRQVCLGLAASGVAVLTANVLLWGGVCIYAALAGKVLGNLLWGYPVLWHIVLCILLAAGITALYTAPMLRIRKYLPIDNIRTRK